MAKHSNGNVDMKRGRTCARSIEPGKVHEQPTSVKAQIWCEDTVRRPALGVRRYCKTFNDSSMYCEAEAGTDGMRPGRSHR